MKVISTDTGGITIYVERSELAFLCNAINETLEAIEDWEFQIQTGVKRNDAIALLAQLQDSSKPS